MPGIAHSNSAASIEFDGDTFVLKYHKPLPNGFVNEYFLPAESPDSWTKLISVQLFTELADHGAAVRDLIRMLLAYNPQARYEAWKADDGTFTGVDFVTWHDENYVEFNIFIYRSNPTGRGLLAHQYAARAFGDDRAAFLNKLASARGAMLQKVVAFQFPPIVLD